MPTNEQKGITVKVDAQLHAEVRRYLESHDMTMADFVELALRNELHPKAKGEKNMENVRTLAVQVPEELFQKIKEYLQRNHMKQKDFLIGLIERELERELTERQGNGLSQENDVEGREEQDMGGSESPGSGENEEGEGMEVEKEEMTESENVGITMGM